METLKIITEAIYSHIQQEIIIAVCYCIFSVIVLIGGVWSMRFLPLPQSIKVAKGILFLRKKKVIKFSKASKRSLKFCLALLQLLDKMELRPVEHQDILLLYPANHSRPNN